MCLRRWDVPVVFMEGMTQQQEAKARIAALPLADRGLKLEPTPLHRAIAVLSASTIQPPLTSVPMPGYPAHSIATHIYHSSGVR